TASYTNRDTGISNIPNSCNTIIFQTASFTIDPNVGCNSSPYFANNHLIEWITVSTNFNATFGAFDPNGDSLAYRIAPCMDTSGTITGYTYPDFIGGGNFSMDAVTGNISWTSPNIPGKYNVVVYIEEWKLMPNNQRLLIETVMRELQFDVGTGVGIHEQNPLAFSCFPDPVLQNGELHFQFEKSGTHFIKLIDAEGKIVFENTVFCEKDQVLNLPSLSAGIYFLTVSDEDHPVSSRKILVQNP
ncbi:MAG TPA: T9SS type A sorting domain-containing protein, partial [Bacteroidia bacterium]|nr:T9SS type A sorting domain-containing protein [Bacteroidia bacterium]